VIVITPTLQLLLRSLTIEQNLLFPVHLQFQHRNFIIINCRRITRIIILIYSGASTVMRRSSKMNIFPTFRLWEFFHENSFPRSTKLKCLWILLIILIKPFHEIRVSHFTYVPWSWWSKSVSKVPLDVSFPLQTIWLLLILLYVYIHKPLPSI
jgi:hypothetical protein